MRIIALYVMSKNGISEENLNKLVTHAEILPQEKQTVANLTHLGINVVVDVSMKKNDQIALLLIYIKYKNQFNFFFFSYM